MREKSQEERGENRAWRALARIAQAATKHSCCLSLENYYANIPCAQECMSMECFLAGRQYLTGHQYFHHCMYDNGFRSLEPSYPSSSLE